MLKLKIILCAAAISCGICLFAENSELSLDSAVFPAEEQKQEFLSAIEQIIQNYPESKTNQFSKLVITEHGFQSGLYDISGIYTQSGAPMMENGSRIFKPGAGLDIGDASAIMREEIKSLAPRLKRGERVCGRLWRSCGDERFIYYAPFKSPGSDKYDKVIFAALKVKK